jgi:hypothetical protein
MINLKPFCSTDQHRPYIMQPFSRGEFTYATDGRLMVRVPRRAEVPEVDTAPQAERVFPKPPATAFRPAAKVELPPPTSVECEICEGRGMQHDCPDCTCECEPCDGTGKISSDVEVSLSIGGVPFGLRYVRPIMALPSLEIAVPVNGGKSPLEFRFDGGDGIIMPRTEPCATHLDIDLAPRSAP